MVYVDDFKTYKYSVLIVNNNAYLFNRETNENEFIITNKDGNYLHVKSIALEDEIEKKIPTVYIFEFDEIKFKNEFPEFYI